MVERVSTASLHNQNLRDMSLVQVDLAKLNRQISSGNKADTYQELNGSVERVSAYNTKLASIDNYTKTNTTVLNKLNTQDQALDTIQQAAEKFSSLLSANKNAATGNASTFVSQAKSILTQIAASLNTTNNGSYVFSGSQTNIAAVATPIPSPTNAGTPDNNYYQGDANTGEVRVSDTQKITFGITAGDPAFQNLIGSIQTAIAAYSTPSPSAPLLAKATDLLNSSIKGVASLRSIVGVNQGIVNSANDTAATAKTYLQQALSEDTSTDIAQATIQLSTDQTVLQATYSAFASLSKLKLTDYLN